MDTPLSIGNIIVQHYESGLYTQQQIANMVRRPRSTVRDIIHHYEATKTPDVQRKGHCGRRKLLNVREERAILRKTIVNPRLTAREIQAEVGGTVATVSVDTVK
jgi:transposase